MDLAYLRNIQVNLARALFWAYTVTNVNCGPLTVHFNIKREFGGSEKVNKFARATECFNAIYSTYPPF